MSYKDEWLVIEANDDIDEMEHREPSEEFCSTVPWPTAMWMLSAKIASRAVLWIQKGLAFCPGTPSPT